MNINEYNPKGYTNWTQYLSERDRKERKAECIKNVLAIVLLVMLLIGSYVGIAYLETVL